MDLLSNVSTRQLDSLREWFDNKPGKVHLHEFIAVAGKLLRFGAVDMGSAAGDSFSSSRRPPSGSARTAGGLSSSRSGTAGGLGGGLGAAPGTAAGPLRPLTEEAVAVLKELFERADRDCCGAITWSDMTNALMPPSVTPGSGLPQSKSLMVERNSYRFGEVLDAPIRVPYSHIPVSRVRVFPEIGLACVCFQGQSSLVLYRCFNEEDETADGLPFLGTIDAATGPTIVSGPILDVGFMPKEECLVMTVGDFSMQIYDISKLIKLLRPRLLGQSAISASGMSLGEDGLPDDTAFDASPAGGDGEGGAGEGGAAGGGGAGGGGLGDSKKSTRKPLNGRLVTFVARTHVPVPQHTLLWIPEVGKLLTSNVSGDITIWHVYVGKKGWGMFECFVKPKGTLRVHKGAVGDMVLMKDIGLIASAGIDGSTALWAVKGMVDGVGGRRGVHDSKINMLVFKIPGQASAGIFLHRHFKGVHKHGGHSLLYLSSIRMLVSAGYDKNLQVYDLLNEDGVPSFLLEGHMARVVSLTSLDPVDLLARPPSSPFLEDGDIDLAALGALDKGKLVSDTAALEVGMQGGAAAGANMNSVHALMRMRPGDHPPGKLPPHLAQLVSLDETGEVRWWTLSRNASVLNNERCLQVMQPVNFKVPKPEAQPRALFNVRCTLAGEAWRVYEDNKAAKVGLDSAGGGGGGGGGGGSGSGGSGGKKGGAGSGHRSMTGRNHGEHRKGAVLYFVSPSWRCFSAVSLRSIRSAVTAVLFQRSTMQLLGVSGRDVKWFHSHSGELATEHRDLLPTETLPDCLVMDKGQGRLIVGCKDGRLLVLDAHSGSFIRTLPRHVNDITGVAYAEEDGLLMSVSMDGTLQVVDESGLAKWEHSDGGHLETEEDKTRRFLLRRVRNAHGYPSHLSTVAYDETTSFIATGGTDGSIRIWDFQRLTYVACLAGHEAEINCLAFVPFYSLLVSGDARGFVNIWHLPRGSAATCLASFCLAAGKLCKKPTPEEEFQEEVQCRVQEELKRARRERNLLEVSDDAMKAIIEDIRLQAEVYVREQRRIREEKRAAEGALKEDPRARISVQNLRSFAEPFVPPSGGTSITAITFLKGSSLAAAGVKTTATSRQHAGSKGSIAAEAAPEVTVDVEGTSSAEAEQYPVMVLGDASGHVSWWPLEPILKALYLTEDCHVLGLEEALAQGYNVASGKGQIARRNAEITGPALGRTASIMVHSNEVALVREALPALQPSQLPSCHRSYNARKQVYRDGTDLKTEPLAIPVSLGAGLGSLIVAHTGEASSTFRTLEEDEEDERKDAEDEVDETNAESLLAAARKALDEDGDEEGGGSGAQSASSGRPKADSSSRPGTGRVGFSGMEGAGGEDEGGPQRYFTVVATPARPSTRLRKHMEAHAVTSTNLSCIIGSKLERLVAVRAHGSYEPLEDGAEHPGGLEATINILLGQGQDTIWVGTPVRTLTVVDQPEVQCVFSGGDDGFICTYALSGRLSGRMSCALGVPLSQRAAVAANSSDGSMSNRKKGGAAAAGAGAGTGGDAAGGAGAKGSTASHKEVSILSSDVAAAAAAAQQGLAEEEEVPYSRLMEAGYLLDELSMLALDSSVSTMGRLPAQKRKVRRLAVASALGKAAAAAGGAGHSPDGSPKRGRSMHEGDYGADVDALGEEASDFDPEADAEVMRKALAESAGPSPIKAAAGEEGRASKRAGPSSVLSEQGSMASVQAGRVDPLSGISELVLRQHRVRPKQVMQFKGVQYIAPKGQFWVLLVDKALKASLRTDGMGKLLQEVKSKLQLQQMKEDVSQRQKDMLASRMAANAAAVAAAMASGMSSSRPGTSNGMPRPDSAAAQGEGRSAAGAAAPAEGRQGSTATTPVKSAAAGGGGGGGGGAAASPLDAIISPLTAATPAGQTAGAASAADLISPARGSKAAATPGGAGSAAAAAEAKLFSLFGDGPAAGAAAGSPPGTAGSKAGNRPGSAARRLPALSSPLSPLRGGTAGSRSAAGGGGGPAGPFGSPGNAGGGQSSQPGSSSSRTAGSTALLYDLGPVSGSPAGTAGLGSPLYLPGTTTFASTMAIANKERSKLLDELARPDGWRKTEEEKAKEAAELFVKYGIRSHHLFGPSATVNPAALLSSNSGSPGVSTVLQGLGENNSGLLSTADSGVAMGSAIEPQASIQSITSSVAAFSVVGPGPAPHRSPGQAPPAAAAGAGSFSSPVKQGGAAAAGPSISPGGHSSSSAAAGAVAQHTGLASSPSQGGSSSPLHSPPTQSHGVRPVVVTGSAFGWKSSMSSPGSLGAAGGSAVRGLHAGGKGSMGMGNNRRGSAMSDDSNLSQVVAQLDSDTKRTILQSEVEDIIENTIGGAAAAKEALAEVLGGAGGGGGQGALQAEASRLTVGSDGKILTAAEKASAHAAAAAERVAAGMQGELDFLKQSGKLAPASERYMVRKVTKVQPFLSVGKGLPHQQQLQQSPLQASGAAAAATTAAAGTASGHGAGETEGRPDLAALVAQRRAAAAGQKRNKLDSIMSSCEEVLQPPSPITLPSMTTAATAAAAAGSSGLPPLHLPYGRPGSASSSKGGGLLGPGESLDNAADRMGEDAIALDNAGSDGEGSASPAAGVTGGGGPADLLSSSAAGGGGGGGGGGSAAKSPLELMMGGLKSSSKRPMSANTLKRMGIVNNDDPVQDGVPTVKMLIAKRNPDLIRELDRIKERSRKSTSYKSLDSVEIAEKAAARLARSMGMDYERVEVDAHERERREDRLVRAMALSVIADMASARKMKGTITIPPGADFTHVIEVPLSMVKLLCNWTKRVMVRKMEQAEAEAAAKSARGKGGSSAAAGENGSAPAAGGSAAAVERRPSVATGEAALASPSRSSMAVGKGGKQADADAASAAAVAATGSPPPLRKSGPLAVKIAPGAAVIIESGRAGSPTAGSPSMAKAVTAAEAENNLSKAFSNLQAARALTRKDGEGAAAAGGAGASPSKGGRGRKGEKSPSRPGSRASSTGKGGAGSGRPGSSASGRASSAGSTLQRGETALQRWRRRNARAKEVLTATSYGMMLTPEEYRQLLKRAKVGGELKRDVLAFKGLVERADPGKTGKVPFETFMVEMRKARGLKGHSLMSRQLEMIFRSADTEGTGFLPVLEFARIIFPRATEENLKQILAFIFYCGPTPDQVDVEYIRRYRPGIMANLKELFNVYDADGSGTIDRSELEDAFKNVRGMYARRGSAVGAGEDAETMLNFDADGDGQIDFEEFLQIFGPFFIDDDS